MRVEELLFFLFQLFQQSFELARRLYLVRKSVELGHCDKQNGALVTNPLLLFFSPAQRGKKGGRLLLEIPAVATVLHLLDREISFRSCTLHTIIYISCTYINAPLCVVRCNEKSV
jgi:hypothetical protein